MFRNDDTNQDAEFLKLNISEEAAEQGWRLWETIL